MTKYPLAWPAGWPRTRPSSRYAGKFAAGAGQTEGGRQLYRELTVADATQRVVGELRRFGVIDGESIISTNVKTRLDGFPRSDQPQPADPGAAVYWQRPEDKGTKCMAIDIYSKVEHNIAAIAATLNAMRAIERHGGAQILNRAFEGFIALPAGRKPWRQFFGFGDDEQVSELRLKDAYRTACSEAHPDREGGSHDAFLEVQAAYSEAARELGLQP